MEIIFAYTRKDALEDGELVDVTEAAARHGFRVPTAITGPFFNEGIAVEDEGLDFDLFWLLLRKAIAEAGTSADRIRFRYRNLELIAVMGPDDDGKPCLTIGFPEDF